MGAVPDPAPPHAGVAVCSGAGGLQAAVQAPCILSHLPGAFSGPHEKTDVADWDVSISQHGSGLWESPGASRVQQDEPVAALNRDTQGD